MPLVPTACSFHSAPTCRLMLRPAASVFGSPIASMTRPFSSVRISIASAPCSIRPILSSEPRAARQSSRFDWRSFSSSVASSAAGASPCNGSMPAEVLRTQDCWITERTLARRGNAGVVAFPGAVDAAVVVGRGRRSVRRCGSWMASGYSRNSRRLGWLCTSSAPAGSVAEQFSDLRGKTRLGPVRARAARRQARQRRSATSASSSEKKPLARVASTKVIRPSTRRSSPR